MVADAKSLEEGTAVELTDPKTYRDFRGSWSGYERDCLFHNPDGPAQRFVNEGYLYGLDFDDDGRSAAPVDIDGDGDLDLVCLSLQGLRVMENTYPKRAFARIRLESRPGRPVPLNAVVKVTAGGVTQQDYVKMTDGFQTQVPLDLHFGLAGAAKIDAVEIAWPGGGATARFEGLPVDRLLVFREGEAAPAISELPQWPAESRPRIAPDFSPDLVATTLAGGEERLAEPGKPAVVNFWAPSCAPCKQEMPMLAAASKRYAGRVRFAEVSTDIADPADVAGVARQFGVEGAQFLANDAVVRSFFGAEKAVVTPSTFVFDKAGKLRRVFQRPLAAGELEGILDTLLDESVPSGDLARLAWRLIESGRIEEGLPYLRTAVKEFPDDALISYNLGVALLKLGRDKEALQPLKRSVEIDSGFARSRHNYAEALRRTGSFAEAAEQYLQAIRIRGDEYEFCWGLGDCYLRLNRNDDALLAFDRAIAIDRRQPRALKSKSVVLARMGKMTEAASLLRKVLELTPDDKEAAAWLEQMK